MERKPTVHEIIHALEQVEEAYGEGVTIEKIRIEVDTLTVYDTKGAALAVFPIGDWE